MVTISNGCYYIIYCRVFKFKNETPGMFCAIGKVKLPELYPLPEIINISIRWHEHIETFLSKHPQKQFMFRNDIIRGNEYCARQLHTNIQSVRSNLSLCWFITTNARYEKCSNRNFEVYDGNFILFIKCTRWKNLFEYVTEGGTKNIVHPNVPK